MCCHVADRKVAGYGDFDPNGTGCGEGAGRVLMKGFVPMSKVIRFGGHV